MAAKNKIEYEKCSNVVIHNGETIYLNKIIWEDGLTYDDIKEFVIKSKVSISKEN